MSHLLHPTVPGHLISNQAPLPCWLHAAHASPGWLSRRLVFRGRETRHDPGSTTFVLERPGALLRGWVTNSDAARALVYLGGNSEDTRGWHHLLRGKLPGRASYLVGYRGYGASEGRPTERDLVEDAVALVADVASRHESVAVLGRSLGSGVAVQVAADPRVAGMVEGVVLVTPFDSLARVVRSMARGLPLDWLLADRFRSDRHVGRVRAPVLVLRAGRDSVVRPDSTDRLVALLPAGSRVIDFPDADHRSISVEHGYWRALQRFLGERVTFEREADRDGADPWILEGE